MYWIYDGKDKLKFRSMIGWILNIFCVILQVELYENDRIYIDFIFIFVRYKLSTQKEKSWHKIVRK